MSAGQDPCQVAPPTISEALRTQEALDPPTRAARMEAPTITVVPTTTREALSRVLALLPWETSTAMVIPRTPTIIPIMGLGHLMGALTMMATMAALRTPSGAHITMVIPPTITVATMAARRTPSGAHTTMVIPLTPTIIPIMGLGHLGGALTKMMDTMAALRTPSGAHTTMVDPRTTSTVATTPTIIVATRTQWGATTRCAVLTALTTLLA